MKYRKIMIVILSILAPFVIALHLINDSHANSEITVSPMYQKDVLVPGQSKTLSFTLANPADSDQDLEYEIEVRPFSVNDENSVTFTAKEDYSQIVDWIEFDEEEGVLSPNGKTQLDFTVNVPKNAPAGGQYAAIIVKSKNDVTEGVLINNIFEVSHLIYAEVAGETVRQGKLNSIDIPGFMFSGNITGSASITNTGNVHSNVTHILQVYPLIGNEEYYTNEEDPQTNLIMPGATRYTSISWEKTPSIGVFRVKYSVEFEGVKDELEKIVIICPLWLMFIIALIVVLLIGKFIFGKRKEKK